MLLTKVSSLCQAGFSRSCLFVIRAIIDPTQSIAYSTCNIHQCHILRFLPHIHAHRFRSRFSGFLILISFHGISHPTCIISFLRTMSRALEFFFSDHGFLFRFAFRPTISSFLAGGVGLHFVLGRWSRVCQAKCGFELRMLVPSLGWNVAGYGVSEGDEPGDCRPGGRVALIQVGMTSDVFDFWSILATYCQCKYLPSTVTHRGRPRRLLTMSIADQLSRGCGGHRLLEGDGGHKEPLTSERIFLRIPFRTAEIQIK